MISVSDPSTEMINKGDHKHATNKDVFSKTVTPNMHFTKMELTNFLLASLRASLSFKLLNLSSNCRLFSWKKIDDKYEKHSEVRKFIFFISFPTT